MFQATQHTHILFAFSRLDVIHPRRPVTTCLPVASKDDVPKNNVLSIVALGDPVVNIVCLGIKDFDSKQRKDNVVTGVVDAGQETPKSDKQQTTANVDLK